MPNDFVINRSMYAEAYAAGMTFSAFLEGLDRSSEYSAADLQVLGGDAFQRQLRKLDVRTASVPIMGVAAHSVERFFDNEDGLGDERSAMFPEWMARIYRQTSALNPPQGNTWVSPMDTQNRLLTSHNPLSDVLWPEAVETGIRFQMLEPSLLSYLVGRTRTIDSDVFRAFYLADSTVEDAARMHRVSEYAEVPEMTIAGGDHTISVKKYGRRLKASYESIRRVSLDVMAFAISYIAAKADNDKTLTAIDILINGDGNTGSAATSSNGSTYDSGASSVLTLKMWLGWGMIWKKPHQPNVVLGTNDSILRLLLLQAASANLPPEQLVRAAGGLGPITLARPIYGGMVAINDSTVTASNLLQIDSRYSLELVTEAGSDIVETDRIINRQYEEVVITESVGFDIMTLGQNKLLDWSA